MKAFVRPLSLRPAADEKHAPGVDPSMRVLVLSAALFALLLTVRIAGAACHPTCGPLHDLLHPFLP